MNDKITIIRAPRNSENPYFMQRRATAQDERLSYEARGVLSYLLSKPGDWEIRPDDLVRVGCKRDRVYRILTELKDAGYLKRDRVRVKGGKWQWQPYELYESPFTEKPEMVDRSPFPVLPDMVNTEIKEQSTEQEQIKDSAEKESAESDLPNPTDEGSTPVQETAVHTTNQDSPESPDQDAAAAGGGRRASKPREKTPYDLLFEAVAAHIFDTHTTEGMNTEGGRIGMITAWLGRKKESFEGRGKAGRVGFIGSPAESRHVEQFAAYWKASKNGITPPHDPIKFVEEWRAWASQSRKAVRAELRIQPKAAERHNETMTADELEARRNDLRALRAQVRAQ